MKSAHSVIVGAFTSIAILFIHATALIQSVAPEISMISRTTTKFTACAVLPSIVRMLSPYVITVSAYVPESNWNMPRPPCIAEHGPSAAPAMIGPPPHDDDAGPLQA